jgi:hypothetical protein
MTIQPPAHPQPSGGPSPDVLEQTRTALKQEKVRARSAMAVAVITTIGGVAGSFIAFSAGRNDAQEATTAPVSSTSVSIDPIPGGIITWPLKGFTGTVENLGPGQTVWGFQQAAGADAFFSTNGPCPVKDGRWNCRDWYVGPGTSDRGQYKLWAAVVSDAQSADLVYKLSQRAGVPAGAGAEPDHVSNAIEEASGTRDGT